MSDEYEKSIFESFDQRETKELIEIWQKHDPDEWTDTAYEVIEKILLERLGELPQIKGEESDVQDGWDKDRSDGYQPEFYNPQKVLILEKWIDYAIYIGTASIIFMKIRQFNGYLSLINNYLRFLDQTNFLVILLAVILMVLDAALYWVFIYFPFKALKKILQILMQMEFNSR